MVYLAFDPDLQRDVAIKTISSGIADENLRERFIREARSVGRMRHANIITVYDFGRAGEQMYLAMEFLEGRDLDLIISGNHYMDIRDKLDIIRQICLGLEYAHQNEICHRDIKPSNIKVLPDGHVKIMDFGLAVMHASTITQTGAVLGTPHYMAPEIVRGEKASPLSDQFSLGLVMYELLTYRRSFSGDSIPAILYQILNGEPMRLAAALTERYPALEAIIVRAIRKNPAERYPSLRMMAEEIQELMRRLEKDGFSMREPASVMEESMPTAREETFKLKMRDTAKTPRFKNSRLAWGSIVAVAAALVAVYFLLIAPIGGKPAAEPGFLAFDAKPYAIIQSLTALDTGEKTTPDKEAALTPVRLALPPGRYEITYNHPQSPGEKRSRLVTVTAGQTTYETDTLEPQLTERALRYFSLTGRSR